MTRLTSVYGSFRARVMAARLETEGFDVELRGNVDGPYALTVGEMARVDVYVPSDQIEDASLVLLVDEVDAVDDDTVPIDRRRPATTRWLARAVLFVLLAAPLVRLVRWG